MDFVILERYKQAIAPRFQNTLQRVEDAAIKAGRDPSGVRIVAVSKLHPPEAVVAAILSGVTDIGENRVQEAAAKRPEVESILKVTGFNNTCVRWHMVGSLQSNKAVKAARLFDVIQSLESIKVANILSRTAEEDGKRLEVLVEVNTSGERTKAGIKPENVTGFIKEIILLPALQFTGLMTVGPMTEDKTLIMDAFSQLCELRDIIKSDIPDLNNGNDLSMGMSDDFPIGISMGATMVRIGTAIFGPRQNVKKVFSIDTQGEPIA